MKEASFNIVVKNFTSPPVSASTARDFINLLSNRVASLNQADYLSSNYQLILTYLNEGIVNIGNAINQTEVELAFNNALNKINAVPRTVSTPAVPVTGLNLSEGPLNLLVGGLAGVVSATISPANATNKVIIWASNNEAVATVNNGVVTPLTATTGDGSFEQSLTVNVSSSASVANNVASITIIPTAAAVVITFNGTNVASGSASAAINLVTSTPTTVTIVVT